MSRVEPRPAQYGVARLSALASAKLASMIAEHGEERTIAILGTSRPTLDCLLHGGRVRAATVERLERRLLA